MYRSWCRTVAWALCLGLAACGTTRQGSLEIYLTDQPLNLQSVVVTLSQIEIHSTGGPWKPFYQGPVTVDLMRLQGTQSLLAMNNVDDGKYTGFRLLVQSGYIIDTSNQRCDLEVPSDKVEVPVVFEVQQGHITHIVADFDGPASVQVVGTGNAQKCLLRPVIVPKSVEMR